MLKFRATAGAAIAAAGLAVGGLAVGATAAQAAPQAQHGSALSACQKWARAHTRVYITKATGNSRKGLTVSGEMVKVYCGGPDDFHFIITNKHFTGHLRSNAKINILVFGNNGIEFPRLPEAKFAHWVKTDHNSGVYQVTGSLKSIRGLTELYHP